MKIAGAKSDWNSTPPTEVVAVALVQISSSQVSSVSVMVVADRTSTSTTLNETQSPRRSTYPFLTHFGIISSGSQYMFILLKWDLCRVRACPS